MRIIIATTDLGTVDKMLRGWQNGKQWGVLNPTEKKLWKENADGVRVAANGQDLMQVYNEATGIVYMLACIRNWKGKLTISEVVSNPQVAMEKDSANEAGKVFLNWLSKNNPDTDKQGLGCLFAWAAKKSTSPLSLTANTFGLIKLYRAYGFEVNGPAKPGVEKYIANPEVGLKYTKIDQNMSLSELGKNTLLKKYQEGREWIS